MLVTYLKGFLLLTIEYFPRIEFHGLSWVCQRSNGITVSIIVGSWCNWCGKYDYIASLCTFSSVTVCLLSVADEGECVLVWRYCSGSRLWLPMPLSRGWLVSKMVFRFETEFGVSDVSGWWGCVYFCVKVGQGSDWPSSWLAVPPGLSGGQLVSKMAFGGLIWCDVMSVVSHSWGWVWFGVKVLQPLKAPTANCLT
jgi:hypothetical protein